jgi:hypothetical protein
MPKKAVTSAATMIPLAIGLLSTAIMPPAKGGGGPTVSGSATTVEAVACGEGIEDFRACHTAYPTGCSSSGNYDPYLNLMKNQLSWATTQPEGFFTTLQEYQDLEAKLPDDLGKSNHGDNLAALANLGEGKIHGVIGYLYDIKVEGKESSNCQLEGGTDNENVDYHIFIGFDGDLAKKIQDKKPLTAEEHKAVTQQSVIVEMTPQYRDQNHPEWTAEAVAAQKGKQVKVIGQLMVDNEHYVSGQDCGRKDHTANCWRASVWELHPVTDFQVCNSGTCTQTSAGWSPIGQ